MAVLVRALGALMSICGIASILSGAGILTDKDWVSVLAGVVALSGGIVTLALAFVLQTLLEMRDAMRQTAGFSEPARAPVQASDEPIIALDTPMPRPDPSQSLMTRELESGMLAAILSSHTSHDLHQEASVAPSHEGETERHPERDVIEPHDPVDRNYPFPESDTHEPSLHEASHHETSHEEVRHHDGDKLTLPEPDGPAMDDWLDREFSALGSDNPPLTPVHHHELEPAHVVDHGHDAMQADHAPASSHDDLLLHEDARHPPSSSVALAEPAVIGRYEADGTVYIMFADGSIEAQSGAGIFRFSSMTDLKSHIESAN